MPLVKQTQTNTAFRAQQDRFRLFVAVLLVFLGLLPVVFWTVGESSLRSYFILAFIWFLISSEVFAPSEPETVWWRRLRWIKAAGWLILMYIISERVMAVI